MKKYILLLFIFCLQLVPAKAQWVTIPDVNFVNKLTQLFPSCMNGNQMDTTCSQIVNLPSIDLSSLYITDIEGIQYFDNLLVLNCEDNQLTSLPNLPSTLWELYCGYNQLTNISNLPNELIILDCPNNQITNIDNFPNTLLGLFCGFNQLSGLPQVPNVMEYFGINNNNISCLINLPELVTFSGIEIDISNNLLTCVPNQTNYNIFLPLCMENDVLNNPNNCAGINIIGNVFHDMNNNCTHDYTDTQIQNYCVKLYDSQNNLINQSYTSNGVYSFSTLLPDTYQVKIDTYSQPLTMACSQSNTETVILSSANQTIPNINFSVNCDSINDLYVHSVNQFGFIFPGQTHILKTNISSTESWYNLECSTNNYSGTVTLNILGPVTYISTLNNVIIPQISGNTFNYNVSDFNVLTPNSFGLILKTDTTAQAGDQICVHIEINPTPLDADTTNNVYDFCYQVVNSYDPNMKEVYPVNVLPGYDDWFTYTIHFQNTGNAPAFNIRLRDTLDANLDINTFEIRGYSHPAIVSINGNILTVRFNNIMLPDSTTDYEGSMGYFQYRIKPLPNLPLGTQIENTAYIYFDYNAPIVTNTTQNNFQTVVSTFNGNDDTNQLKVFPNPANQILNINLQNNNIENCIITNALGQIVYSSANEINANHKIQLNISNLNHGVYFVKVRAGNGSYNAKFVKSE